jgi:tetratricopeptide (TPR) repeat protein
MILTQCAVCATELGFSLGKKCGRCSTRYCGAACQVQHWKEGGHDQLCKKIKKAGGAEQYNANKKYTEAVSVAVEKCADDTKGQTCYICTQALHWKTKEGLVRGCSCRGTAGFAHVSCLVEEAKLLFAEAEEDNLDWNAKNPRWLRWCLCSLCEQYYHGVVACALGWACWKTYLGRPETDQVHGMAKGTLGNGLSSADHHEDALLVRQAELSMLRRVGPASALDDRVLTVQGNLANTYEELGRKEEAVSLRRDVYSGRLNLNGEENHNTLREAYNYAVSLIHLERYEEAKSLIHKTTPVARRVLGESHELTLKMRKTYAQSLCEGPSATLDDLREGMTTLEEIERIARRVFGGAHPFTAETEQNLQVIRAALRVREANVSAIRNAMAATTLGDA